MTQRTRPRNHSQSNGFQRQALGTSQGSKPNSGSRRRWSQACHQFGLFLRKIGFGILVTSIQGFFTKNFPEPEKVAIRQSRLIALLTALIHVLPVGLAIFEIILNWKGYFVGALFDKQNSLQFAAKAHEIFMQASIATIILSYIRYQTCASKGMPFGAIFGALQLYQVSYLWSVELWSAITSKNFQPRKKICFVVLIFVCITVTATAGPSSANLLIARQGIWQRTSSYLAINATFQEIWPSRLGDESISGNCKMMKFPSTADFTSRDYADDCPFSSLVRDVNRNEANTKPLLSHLYSDTTLFVEVPTLAVDDTYFTDLLIGHCFKGWNDQICSTNPQGVLLGGLLGDSAAKAQEEGTMGVEGYHILKENYYQPYTTVRCAADTVQSSSDEAPLRFPILSEMASELEKGQETSPVPGLTKGRFTYNIPGNSSEFRVDWVDLPQETFGTGVPGAIIVHPQTSSILSYNVTTCTLSAGWGSSSIFTDSQDFSDIFSHTTQTPPSRFNPSIPVGHDPNGYIYTNRPLFGNFSDFSYPQLHINISTSWTKFTNPLLTLPDNSTISLLSMMMSKLSSRPEETEAHELAMVLSFMLVSALSSTGMEHDAKVFQERTQASESCKNCLVFEIENLVWGWKYTAEEATTKLAIAVMFTYCILVLGHVIYSAISGVSSTAWDSVSELVALAMNSTPTKALQNTCAGITGSAVYQTQVRILKTSEKHLELVFGEVTDPNADITKLVMNEEYGAIAVGKEDDVETLEGEEKGEIRKRAST